MEAQKFQSARISVGKYKTNGYSSKEYSTVSGFKKGLKSKNCPFDIDKDGLFDNGTLKSRSWNCNGTTITAYVNFGYDC